MGVQIGLSNLHYALLLTDPVDGTDATYEAPIKVPGVITANINPNPSSETLFADNGPMEVASTIGQIELELVTAELPIDVQAILLGHTVANGIIVKKATDVAPWVAIGFESLKSNGSKKFVWLYKGKFMEPEMNHETKGDGVSFQTPTIGGRFVKRDSDDVWQVVADEESTTYKESVGTAWFTTVIDHTQAFV